MTSANESDLIPFEAMLCQSGSDSFEIFTYSYETIIPP